MWTVKKSGGKLHLLGDDVHLPEEILGVVIVIIELVTLDPYLVTSRILLSEQDFAKKLRERKGSIISTG